MEKYFLEGMFYELSTNKNKSLKQDYIELKSIADDKWFAIIPEVMTLRLEKYVHFRLNNRKGTTSIVFTGKATSMLTDLNT